MSAGGNMDVDREALMHAFVSEADETLGGMEQWIIALERRPDDAATLQALFRSAHTLKGNASILGLDAFRELAHALEDVLDGLRSRRISVSGELVTGLLAALDALRDLIPGAVQAKGHEEREAVLRLLVVFAAGIAGAGGVAGPRGAGGVPEPAAVTVTGGRGAEARGADAEPVLRVRLGKLDHLLALVQRISVLESQLGAILLGAWEDRTEDLRELHGRIERLLMELQDWVMDARMVPVGPVFRGQARTLRDVSRAQGKSVRLRTEGEEVAVDTSILEAVRDALTHLVRNAVDHGLEGPTERVARGKPAEGTITLRAFHEASRIVIQVSDDGVGFDLAKIRARALALGIAGAQDLPVEALHRLVFEPGFSTAGAVTDLSGRGVGLDVVLRRVEALHGAVGVHSREGEGATVELRLPLTLSVIEGFWVRAGGEDYVIPLGEVVECLELPEGDRSSTAGRGLIDLRGEPVPFFHLRTLFALGTAAPAVEQVVVVRHGGRKLGVAVDEIQGQRQTAIKPLNRLFRRLSLVSGSTLRPDGRVALVLDVPGLLRAAAQPADRGLETPHHELS